MASAAGEGYMPSRAERTLGARKEQKVNPMILAWERK
jgi:hypothetical protein